MLAAASEVVTVAVMFGAGIAEPASTVVGWSEVILATQVPWSMTVPNTVALQA